MTLGTKLQVSRRPAGPLKPLGKLTGPVQFLGVLGVSKGLWGPYSSQVLQVIQVFRKWLSKSPKRHFEFHQKSYKDILWVIHPGGITNKFIVPNGNSI